MTGFTCSTNFLTANPFQATNHGPYNVFVAKISTSVTGPFVSLSVLSLTFGPQVVDTTSAAQTVTVTNGGTGNLDISTVTEDGTNPGDFTVGTDTCSGATLEPKGTCTVSVTFTPSETGSRSAFLIFTDNNNGVAGSTQTVSLTGPGGAQVAGVSPSSVTFGDQNVGTTTWSQPVTLSNTGSDPLAISSIATSANFGQTNNCGASVATSGSCTIIVSFSPATTGTLTGTLTITDNSNGVAGSTQTVSLSGTGTPAQTFTTLHSFDGTDGEDPVAGLVQATDGNLYGTTNQAGADGAGTVFKITPSGTLTTLYSFCSQNSESTDCTDGGYPSAGLVQGTDGNFYGTTGARGANSYFGGTVFKITPTGTLTTLHEFCSQGASYGNPCADGGLPLAGLVQGTDGNLYGTTEIGGANPCFADSGGYGCGTVFKITPGGTLTTLYSFDSTDGALPEAGLIRATDGNIYGTTFYGGANGAGTVFKITPSGTLTTIYSSCSQSGGYGEPCADGGGPLVGLVQGTDGNFYGTTSGGGRPTTPSSARPSKSPRVAP